METTAPDQQQEDSRTAASDRAIPETVKSLASYKAAVVPCDDGTWQVEWHAGNVDIEIEYDASGRPTFAYVIRAGDDVDITRDLEFTAVSSSVDRESVAEEQK
jgi:hypothetical protein